MHPPRTASLRLPRSLSPSSMVSIPADSDPHPRSLHGTPVHHPVDLPRIASASKGGCWTCRLRRKKCDEQREGNSCRTCLRLTIDCLGWGPKRPEWMRDKHAVESYKANIKAQLTRAGLIRGQPRSSLIRGNPPSLPSTLIPPQSRQLSFHGTPTPPKTTPPPQHFDQSDHSYPYLDPLQRQHQTQDHPSVMPAVPGPSSFHQVPDYTDPSFNGLELRTPYFSYPQSITPISSSSDSLNLDFSHLGGSQDPSTFEFDLPPASLPPQYSFPVGQSNVREHIIYYFENVRKIQLMFAGNTFSNATYSAIALEPTGAVTNAVCALASLHYKRQRVAEGFETPDPNPEHSHAMYFYNEAKFQLDAAKHLRHPNENDALTALHLVCFSQLSGGATRWQAPLMVMCDWLATTGLPTNDNPMVSLRSLAPTSQFLVKATLWLDTLASVTLAAPPKYLGLLQKLLGEQAGYWTAANEADDHGRSIRMDLVTGCPDGAVLAFAEIAMLAHWKATEQRNRTLSYRELVRRGEDIEDRLRQHQSTTTFLSVVDQDPLRPDIPQPSSAEVSFPDEESRRLVAKLFNEVALLLLNTILSNPNPGVAEIRESVERTMQLLKQSTASDVDRALVFPICLAGSMTDDRSHRDLCQGRLQRLDGSIGNVVQACSVMEAVWRKRDIVGGIADFREVLQDQSINCTNLLLI